MASLKCLAPIVALGVVSFPLAAQAQITLLNGTTSGAITFGTQTVDGIDAAGAPVFTNDVVYAGNNYGYLISPRGPGANGGFQDRIGALNQVAAVGPGALPQQLVSGQVGQFGGGSVRSFANNNGAWFNNLALTDVPNDLTLAAPFTSSVAIATNSASFAVGAFGYSGTVGSYFAIGGGVPNPQANAFVAASLTTIIQVFNPNPQLDQTYYARTWLGYKGGANGFIDADGVNSPYANGISALGQPTVQKAIQFGTFGANTFSSAASIKTSANFVAGTTFTVTNYLTMIANLGLGAKANQAVFNIAPAQAPPGVDAPDFGGNSNSAAPEPASLALIGLSCVTFGAGVVRRRRAR